MGPDGEKPKLKIGDDGELIGGEDIPDIPGKAKRSVRRWQRNLEIVAILLLIVFILSLIVYGLSRRIPSGVALAPTSNFASTEKALQTTQTALAQTLTVPTRRSTNTLEPSATPSPTDTRTPRPTRRANTPTGTPYSVEQTATTRPFTPTADIIGLTQTRGAIPCNFVFERETGMRFAYISIVGMDSGLYLMNYGGPPYSASCRPLATSSVYRPAWSPNGKMIAFETPADPKNRTEDTTSIFVINADGSGLKNVATTTKINHGATWSPDNQWIGYTSLGGPDSPIAAYAVNLGTGKLIKYIETPAQGGVTSPQWSPDGKRVLLGASLNGVDGCNRTSCWDLLTANVDGSGLKQVTINNAFDGSASWSPDGSQILFYSKRDEIDAIYVMNADGSNVQRLTDPGSTNTNPVWSPDGQHIAFVSKRTGNSDVWVMDANGSNQRQLTQSAAEDTAPVWAPDGQHIIFIRETNNSKNLFMMDANGNNVDQITDRPLSANYAVSFQPLAKN